MTEIRSLTDDYAVALAERLGGPPDARGPTMDAP